MPRGSSVGSHCSSTSKYSGIWVKDWKAWGEDGGRGGNKTTAFTPVTFCADRKSKPLGHTVTLTWKIVSQVTDNGTSQVCSLLALPHCLNGNWVASAIYKVPCNYGLVSNWYCTKLDCTYKVKSLSNKSCNNNMCKLVAGKHLFILININKHLWYLI